MIRAKVSIIVHRADVVAVAAPLSRLERTEDLRLIESREDIDRHWRELAEAYADRSERLGKLLRVLEIDSEPAPPREDAAPEEDAAELDRTTSEIEGTAEDWNTRHRATEQSIQRLSLLLKGMRRLLPLDIPVGELLGVRFLHLEIGLVPREQWTRLEVLVFRTPAVFIPLFESDEDLVTVAATDREHAVLLERVLHSVFFRPFDWPEDLSGTPVEVAGRLEGQLEEARAEREEGLHRRRELAERWRDRLLELQARVQADWQAASFISRCSRQGEYFFVNGTAPGKDADRLVEIVERTAGGPHAVFSTSPAENGG